MGSTMARIRTIKPEFWTSEQVNDCSPIARLLFIGMWNFCDDGGNHPASPRTLKMQIFPGDDMTAAEIDRMVGELIAAGLLIRYEAEGKSYWHVTGWKHQKIERPNYKFPRPDVAKTDESRQPIADQLPVDRQDVGELSPIDRRIVVDESANDRRAIDEQSPPEGKGREGNVMELSSSRVPRDDDDEEWLNRIAERDRQHQDQRVRFPMTAEWQPDMTELTNHLNVMCGLALVNGVKTTADMLTPEILDRFRHTGFKSDERRTARDWHAGLAKYLVSCIRNPPRQAQRTTSQPAFEQHPNSRPIVMPEPRTDKRISPADVAKLRAELAGVVAK